MTRHLIDNRIRVLYFVAKSPWESLNLSHLSLGINLSEYNFGDLLEEHRVVDTFIFQRNEAQDEKVTRILEKLYQIAQQRPKTSSNPVWNIFFEIFTEFHL